MNAAHTIESAVFEITLDPALLPWPDLATDIEAQLLPVVERVFDATEGGLILDTLEIDLSVTRFNGSWCDLRDRLSEGLRNALKKHRPLVAAATGLVTASAADLARDAPQRAPEETALAAETFDRAFAAYERVRARLQGHDGSDGDLTAEFGQFARPSARVMLQRLVLELRADILPAAGLVERLDKAEMRALIAALASAAEDGADRSIHAKTETYPQHEPEPHSALIARLAGLVGPSEATAPRPGPDLAALGLAEAASPSRWTGTANGISEAADVLTPRRDELQHERAARIAPPGSDRNAPPALQPAAIDGRASEWADPERLIEALRAGSVRQAVLATLLDPAALADLVARLLGGTRVRKPTGPTALLYEAIDRHRAAAGDQRAFLASVAVALAQGVDLDLEALAAAATGVPPSAEAVGETVVPPAASAPAARLGAPVRGIDPAAAPRSADLPAAPDESTGGRRSAESAGDRSQGAVSNFAAAAPAAAIEATVRERLARMLAEGALEPAALAVLLDAPALAALVDHLLAVTGAAAADADTAPLRTAIDRHRAAAGDQRAFLASVAVALAQGVDLDLEALAAAATGVPPSAEAVGETVAPPAASAPAARLGAPVRGIDPAAAPRSADLPAAPDESTGGRRSAESAGDRSQGAVSNFAAAAPAAAIEATVRERLARMLAEGALEPAALAVLLDAPALAALVDHLLAVTGAAAADADTAPLRTAIDRHRAAAGDQRAFLASVAVALAQGVDLDLEALAAAATGVPPSAEVPDTDAPETDALGPLAAQHDRPGAAGVAPDPQAFFVFLKEGAAEPRALLIDGVERSMAQSPAQFARLVRTALRHTPAYTRHESVVRGHVADGEAGSAAFVDEKAILRLVGLLPERLLRRAALLLRPETPPLLLKLFDLIGNALLTDGFARERRAMMARCWPALFRHLLVYGEETDLRRFVANLTATMASNPAEIRRALAAAMVADPLPTEVATQRQVALALLELAGGTADPVADEFAASIAAAIAQPDVVLVAEESAGIDNAGLVLAAPFMPRLFTLLGLLDRGAFKAPEAALHATRVLQYLVDGSAEVGRRSPPLNRILCGVGAAQPEVEARPLGAFEMETVDSLVAMMIERWRGIGNTSSAGLREAFLQRPGRLQRRQEEWHLRVEPRAYDMLLDQLPWSFSIIKHPWMRSPIHVAWR